jgi:hypothetical protein
VSDKKVYEYESRMKKRARRIRNDLKPAAAIRKPPAECGNRDRGEKRPPQRQEKIADKTEHEEASPEDLSFHAAILTRCPAGNESPPSGVSDVTLRKY